MHRSHRLAQPVGLAGEVAAHLVGVQVALGEQVARAGGGHVPALGGVRRERGDHAERVRLTVERRLERSEQPRHVRVAGAGQHPVELDVGVDARGDAAEHLEDRRPPRTPRWCCSARRPTPAARRPAAASTSGSLPKRTRRPRTDRRRRIDQRQQVLPRQPGRTARRRRCGPRRRRWSRRRRTPRSARCPTARSPDSARRCRRCRTRRAAPGRGRRAARRLSAGSAETSSRVRPAYHRCCGSHSANGRFTAAHCCCSSGSRSSNQ